MGTVYPPGILNVFESETNFLSLLNFMVASEIPKLISREEALEMIANCLNPPADASKNPKLAYTIIET